MAGRAWTERELAILRESFRKETAKQVAKRIRRTERAVHQMYMKLGLSIKNKDSTPLQEFIRAKHPLGWSDTDIANAWGDSPDGYPVERKWIQELRNRLGLPSNRMSEHCRGKVAEKTKEQCRAAGVRSLAEVRVKAFREFAVRHGWPADLRPRAVQILDLLYQRGPHTRKQICEATGMPWHGSRKSLHSNDPEGSYLAHLIARGLVVSIRKAIKGRGKGKSCDLYSIAPGIQRGEVCPTKR